MTHNRRDVVATLNASGAGSSQWENLNSGMLQTMRQISVVTIPSSSGATCMVTPPTGIVDTSYFAGTGDVAGGYPHYLMPGDLLNFTWTNGPANGQGVATLYFDEDPL